jgi:hypothetical protein
VITTVGYGDYTPGNSAERIFAIILEFCGMTFFSLLMGLVANFMATFNTGFDVLMQDRFDLLRQWVKKIERSDKPNYINPVLYMQINQQIQDALENDFNLLIEEGTFYQQLTPRMQTDFIKLLFSDFIKQFAHFFDPCEQGFINEFIINMLARIHDKNVVVQMAGKKFRELVFIREGAVGIYDVKGKGPYVILPKHSFFGDYQMLFELKSVYNYKTYVKYDRTLSPCQNEAQQATTVFMCLNKNVFKDLCELYPKTADNLKLRGLERREAIHKLCR